MRTLFSVTFLLNCLVVAGANFANLLYHYGITLYYYGGFVEDPITVAGGCGWPLYMWVHPIASYTWTALVKHTIVNAVIGFYVAFFSARGIRRFLRNNPQMKFTTRMWIAMTGVFGFWFMYMQSRPVFNFTDAVSEPFVLGALFLTFVAWFEFVEGVGSLIDSRKSK